MLYEDPGAMPRAFVAADVEVIPDAEALLRQMAGANLRRVALVEEMAGERLPAGVGGDAEVKRYEASRVAVETRAVHGGLLVLTDRASTAPTTSSAACPCRPACTPSSSSTGRRASWPARSGAFSAWSAWCFSASQSSRRGACGRGVLHTAPRIDVSMNAH